MVLDGKYIRELSHWVNLLLTFIFCYINVHLFYKFFRKVSVSYHFTSRFLQLAEILALFFIVALSFHYFRFKLDLGLAITSLALTFDMVKFYANTVRARVPFLKDLPDYLPERIIPKRKPPKVKS
jgi:hypothetical protein